MPRIEVDLHGAAAIDLIMSRVVTPLSEAWDGELERVAFVFQADAGAAVGFLDRPAMIAELARRAEARDDPRSAELRDIAAQLERGPTEAVQCVLDAFGGLALIELHPDDLRALPDLPGAGSTEDYVLAVHRAASREGARDLAARIRDHTLGALAGPAFPTAPGAVEAADALLAAIDQRWDDTPAVQAAVTEATERTGPLTPTPDGQHLRFLLSALTEAIAQRPPAGFVRSRGGAA